MTIVTIMPLPIVCLTVKWDQSSPGNFASHYSEKIWLNCIFGHMISLRFLTKKKSTLSIRFVPTIKVLRYKQGFFFHENNKLLFWLCWEVSSDPVDRFPKVEYLACLNLSVLVSDIQSPHTLADFYLLRCFQSLVQHNFTKFCKSWLN